MARRPSLGTLSLPGPPVDSRSWGTATLSWRQLQRFQYLLGAVVSARRTSIFFPHAAHQFSSRTPHITSLLARASARHLTAALHGIRTHGTAQTVHVPCGSGVVVTWPWHAPTRGGSGVFAQDGDHALGERARRGRARAGHHAAHRWGLVLPTPTVTSSTCGKGKHKVY